MTFKYYDAHDGKCYCGECSDKIRVSNDPFSFQYFCPEHDHISYSQYIQEAIKEVKPTSKPLSEQEALLVCDKSEYVYEYRFL